MHFLFSRIREANETWYTKPGFNIKWTESEFAHCFARTSETRVPAAYQAIISVVTSMKVILAGADTVAVSHLN